MISEVAEKKREIQDLCERFDVIRLAIFGSAARGEFDLAPNEGILARLREHAGDPAAAWPAKVRGGLPGPVGMYATLAGILATPVALGVLAWWLHQPPAAPRPPATPARPGRRALAPAEHRDAPMLPPLEHGDAS